MSIDNKTKIQELLIFILSIMLIIIIGLLRYYLKSDMTFTMFYLIPIIIVSLYVDKISAWFSISIISVISWCLAELPGYGISLNWLMYWNTITVFVFFTAIAFSHGHLKRMVKREKQLAGTDYLTGLLNNKLFHEMSEKIIARCRREESPISFAYIDLDDFKMINDTYGHNTGDLLLQKVSYSFKKNIRESDIAARLGGDEFAILFPDTDYEQSKLIIERVQSGLLSVMSKNSWPTTFSIGVVTFTNLPYNVEEMVKKADQTMYLVKDNQKNAIKHIIN